MGIAFDKSWCNGKLEKECLKTINPKVVQSTMGSILRVDVIVADLPEFIQSAKMPIYGAVFLYRIFPILQKFYATFCILIIKIKLLIF